jgi:hypothetical protein
LACGTPVCARGQPLDRGRLAAGKDARARAFQDAKSRAEQYAQLSGLSLGKVISISEASAAEAAKVPPAAGRRARQCAAGTRPADGELLGDRDLAADRRPMLVDPRVAAGASTTCPNSSLRSSNTSTRTTRTRNRLDRYRRVDFRQSPPRAADTPTSRQSIMGHTVGVLLTCEGLLGCSLTGRSRWWMLCRPT